MTDLLPPTTPGEILAEEFLAPLCISQYKLARDIGVPRSRIAEIVAGTRAVSADTALRLARYFGLRDQYWLDAQAHHDLQVARDALSEGALAAIVPVQRDAGGGVAIRE
ncbi:HigA family addiction module antitoxin [Actinomycetospora termitidis]|uniref:HigA family addiction module antitoxin n=1 Tax=Actinomycetospora termitidis TaxID=3053470 RepID=A0ABT7MAC5_9PSEU|nr:HigA family addiction module antitoxin [Actinomycetospora sp. Odt1-22]MDL5157609.1 HigA family addiction module antitoxin [Actinomycetospora sp. Odt1-22]